jgi:hypothetical protein
MYLLAVFVLTLACLFTPPCLSFTSLSPFRHYSFTTSCLSLYFPLPVFYIPFAYLVTAVFPSAYVFCTSLPVFLYPLACLLRPFFCVFCTHLPVFLRPLSSLYTPFLAVSHPLACHFTSSALFFPFLSFTPSYLYFLHPISYRLCTHAGLLCTPLPVFLLPLYCLFIPPSWLSFHFSMPVILLPLPVFLLLPAFLFTLLPILFLSPCRLFTNPWLSLYCPLPVFYTPFAYLSMHPCLYFLHPFAYVFCTSFPVFLFPLACLFTAPFPCFLHTLACHFTPPSLSFFRPPCLSFYVPLSVIYTLLLLSCFNPLPVSLFPLSCRFIPPSFLFTTPCLSFLRTHGCLS